MEQTQSSCFSVLKDNVAYKVIQASNTIPSKGKNKIEPISADKDTAASSQDDLAKELDEFVLYLTQELYDALPDKFKPQVVDESNEAQLPTKTDAESLSAPPTFRDSLITYSLVNNEDSVDDMFHSILIAYTEELSSLAEDARRANLPPAAGWKSTRTDLCEICGRDVPLTYHHLIPRSTHDKVLKRKWHPPEMLNVVAWLCRPCHSAVHKSAPNEVLAQHYYSVELLMQRESMQRWADYASRQRWGVRRG
ncbi:hypothetical protein FRC19_002536 [Serendipita sp. 401]|nr:hypothetical protein FRC19_002536 [Serendipita sp. 401]